MCVVLAHRIRNKSADIDSVQIFVIENGFHPFVDIATKQNVSLLRPWIDDVRLTDQQRCLRLWWPGWTPSMVTPSVA